MPKHFWSQVTEEQLVMWLPLVKDFSTGKSIKNAFLQGLAGYKIQYIENGTKLKKLKKSATSILPPPPSETLAVPV